LVVFDRYFFLGTAQFKQRNATSGSEQEIAVAVNDNWRSENVSSFTVFKLDFRQLVAPQPFAPWEVTENATSQAVPDGNTTVRDGELPEPV
jgi:hypothetical protein